MNASPCSSIEILLVQHRRLMTELVEGDRKRITPGQVSIARSASEMGRAGGVEEDRLEENRENHN